MKQRLLIFALCLALCTGICTGGFFLTIQNGSVCYREPGGAWHDTGLHARSALPAQDASLLSRGLHFPSRQALTRALEDFCS